jgi:hypothetical protein
VAAPPSYRDIATSMTSLVAFYISTNRCEAIGNLQVQYAGRSKKNGLPALHFKSIVEKKHTTAGPKERRRDVLKDADA